MFSDQFGQIEVFGVSREERHGSVGAFTETAKRFIGSGNINSVDRKETKNLSKSSPQSSNDSAITSTRSISKRDAGKKLTRNDEIHGRSRLAEIRSRRRSATIYFRVAENPNEKRSSQRSCCFN